MAQKENGILTFFKPAQNKFTVPDLENGHLGGTKIVVRTQTGGEINRTQMLSAENVTNSFLKNVILFLVYLVKLL